jgi:hypothetical protein
MMTEEVAGIAEVVVMLPVVPLPPVTEYPVPLTRVVGTPPVLTTTERSVASKNGKDTGYAAEVEAFPA